MLECTVRKEDQGLKKVPFGCPEGQLDFLLDEKPWKVTYIVARWPMVKASHIVVTESLVFVAEGFVSNLSQTTNQGHQKLFRSCCLWLSVSLLGSNTNHC